MTENRKLTLAKEIQALEAEGRRLASLPNEEFVPGQATPFTAAVAQQHVAVTTKRRELAAIIRREAGLTSRND
jgi:hypothetical protein